MLDLGLVGQQRASVVENNIYESQRGEEKQHCTSGEVGAIWFCWSGMEGVGNSGGWSRTWLLLQASGQSHPLGLGPETSKKNSCSILPAMVPARHLDLKGFAWLPIIATWSQKYIAIMPNPFKCVESITAFGLWSATDSLATNFYVAQDWVETSRCT